MAQAVSTSIIGRSVLAGLTLTAALLAGLVGTDNAYGQAKEPTPERACMSGWAACSPSRR